MRRIDITLDPLSETRLDQLIEACRYTNRSEIIRAAIEREWRVQFDMDSQLSDKVLDEVAKHLRSALYVINVEQNWRADKEDVDEH